MSSPKSGDTQENELAQILIEVEQSLVRLQLRHNQVKQDWSKRSQIKERQQELKQQQQAKSLPQPLKTELRSLQQELERLELTLESVLLPDIFWQVVRFVFLGIAIGWFLHIYAT
jgi:protein subunit release factor A